MHNTAHVKCFFEAFYETFVPTEKKRKGMILGILDTSDDKSVCFRWIFKHFVA